MPKNNRYRNDSPNKINIYKSIIKVNVSHPIIKSELNYAKSKILKELKEKYKDLNVSEIKII